MRLQRVCTTFIMFNSGILPWTSFSWRHDAIKYSVLRVTLWGDIYKSVVYSHLLWIEKKSGKQKMFSIQQNELNTTHLEIDKTSCVIKMLYFLRILIRHLIQRIINMRPSDVMLRVNISRSSIRWLELQL